MHDTIISNKHHYFLQDETPELFTGKLAVTDYTV